MKRRLLVVGIAALIGGSAALADLALAAPAIVVTARSGAPGATTQFVDGSADRGKNALAVDAAGNTYVVGSRWNGSAWRFLVIKYAPDGHELWTALQPNTNGAGDYPYGVDVDAAGNVYVAGTNYSQFITLKYGADGTPLWERRYSFPGGLYQQPRGMAVDAAGNVVVAGRSQAGGFGIDDFDYATVKYDTNGNELWTARYDGPDGLEDEVNTLAIDGDGGVYVTGWSKNANGTHEYATVKYDAAGAQQWVARYGTGLPGNQATDVVVSGGSVVVTGQANFSNNYDAVTIAYDRMTGTQQWLAPTGGTGSGSLRNDGGMTITRDAQGNLYVGGHVWDSDNGFLTAKYDSAGVQQWARNWSPYAGISGSNVAYSIAADPDGGVVAAGRAVGFNGFDYGVAKYDAAGNRQWTQIFNPSPGTLADVPGAVAVRNDGVVVVAGTEAWSQSTTGPDRLTTIFIVDGVQATTPRISVAPSVTGEPYAVNVSVRGKVGFPAGSVSIMGSDGGCGIVLANGDGSCTLTNTTAGAKSLTALFSSDAPTLFASSNDSTTHTVDKAATHLSLAAPPLMRPGEPSTVTVDFGVVAPGAGTPTGDIVVGSGPESCTITPPATSCALTLADAATYTVQASYAGDANFLSSSASTTVRVNRAPTTTNDNYIVAEDNLLIVVAGAGVLSNDTDDEPLHTTAGTFTAGGIGGTVTLSADGSFEYDPPANANGVATFSYTASDGAETATGNVSITVNPVNDPPTFALGANLTHPAATTGAQTVTRYAFNIDLGAPDEAGQPLDALIPTIASDPNGVLSAISFDLDGTLHYTLTGHGGTATVSVVARDGGGTDNGGNDTSAPRTFTITVASGVDLAVSVDNGRRYLRAGSTANYTVELRNTGPDTAHQAQFSITKPSNLTGYAWTCARSDATPCPAASGTSAVAQTLDVPVGVTVTYHVTGTVAALPELPATLTASVSAAASQTELTAANNTASDSDPVGIFADGFDG